MSKSQYSPDRCECGHTQMAHKKVDQEIRIGGFLFGEIPQSKSGGCWAVVCLCREFRLKEKFQLVG